MPMSDSPPDKRSAARVGAGAASVGRLVSRIPADCVEVTVRNVCSTGIGLILDQSVDTTQVEAVVLHRMAPAAPLQISINAVYCVEGKDGPYVLGAKFVQELSDDELKQLTSS